MYPHDHVAIRHRATTIAQLADVHRDVLEVRVVLDASHPSHFGLAERSSLPYALLNALLVWSRCGLGIGPDLQLARAV